MAIVFSNVGELELLDKAIKDALSVDESYTISLFSNNYTPLASSEAGDFTAASNVGGSKTLTRTGWGAATTVGGKASSTYSSAQTWTASGSVTVYGYFVTGSTSGVLLWAERFADTASIVSGDNYTVTPVVTLNSEN